MTKATKSNIVTSLLLIWTITGLSLLALVKTPSFFYQQFETYNVCQNFSSQCEELSKFQEILDYLNFQRPEIDSSFYSEEDILHMFDVRNIFFVIYLTSGFSFCWIIVYLRHQERLKQLLKTAMLISVITASVLFITSLSDFNSLFITFHRLAFTNDYWQLDPSSSNLIKFLPQGLFFNSFLVILVSVLFQITSLNVFAIIADKLIPNGAFEKLKNNNHRRTSDSSPGSP